MAISEVKRADSNSTNNFARFVQLDPMPQKNFKVKGLLKGLRYISQVFEGEKEPEMQIGLPTDVKHVAHIGWDGPSVTNPSWMNDFHSAPLSSSTFGSNEGDPLSPKANSQEIPLGGIRPSPSRDPIDSPKKARRARRHVSSDAVGTNSPARDSPNRGTRHSRKHPSAGSGGSGSEPSDASETRRHRRHSKPDNPVSSGCESPKSDLPAIPKQTRRRRTSKGSDGGSTRSSRRSKDPGSGESAPLPVVVEEE